MKIKRKRISSCARLIICVLWFNEIRIRDLWGLFPVMQKISRVFRWILKNVYIRLVLPTLGIRRLKQHIMYQRIIEKASKNRTKGGLLVHRCWILKGKYINIIKCVHQVEMRRDMDKVASLIASRTCLQEKNIMMMKEVATKNICWIRANMCCLRMMLSEVRHKSLEKYD